MNTLAKVLLVPLLCLFATWATAGGASAADVNEQSTIGPGVGQVTQVFGQLQRDGLNYVEHCDGTFEQGYNWRYGGLGEPYYGAFADRFDLGSGVEVSGIRIYLTQTGYYSGGMTEDLFVWGRGIGEPGAVLGMATVGVEPPPQWPHFSANDYVISAQVGSTFYVGCQSNFVSECDPVWWHHGVDLSGPDMGEPWTCILPSLPYPEGWQDVDVVFGDGAHSMGIGVYYIAGISSVPSDDPQGTVTSWGRIKNLYDR